MKILIGSMVTQFNKVVADTAAELLGRQHRKRKPGVIIDIFDPCDQRRDLQTKRGKPERAKDYRETNRQESGQR